MEGLNFKNSERAYLHPKLEQGDHWMIMDVKLDENDMLQFKGQLNVEVGIGAGDADPNGTFHYNELPVRFGDAKQVYGSYFRDLEGPASGLVRIIFADSPDGPPICYYQSDGPIPTLVFSNDSHGPGAFIRAGA
ncbi:hypothetical protein RSOLAG1IB_02083 [Rhizoctonia solani AG-1 IB]|uniref:Uncharacterized protein n=1 Tax=Thanatephorus cucumeris (strain AG1-IB / isolate 7/3/14) TaxID=1108050 RepID=A0A0B7FK96_THACB|nr:hypothetical protein RSOLAG1IB_02083 [Rhizoctonia solani AG-1 IB]